MACSARVKIISRAGCGLLTPAVLHASRSGRRSPLCFCSDGRPNPAKKNKKLTKIVLQKGNLTAVRKPSHGPFPTCILVLTTSRGVFPKTLAAPAVAPNIAVTMGCISRLGSSPEEAEAKVCTKEAQNQSPAP